MSEKKTKRVIERFHSKSLIPYSIINEAKMKNEDLENMYMSDTIMTWLEKIQPNYRFQEGEEVCHKENIHLKMEVVEIKKEYFTIKNAAGVSEQKLRMRGVDCSWWI